jgi:hypothetical protein
MDLIARWKRRRGRRRIRVSNNVVRGSDNGCPWFNTVQQGRTQNSAIFDIAAM